MSCHSGEEPKTGAKKTTRADSAEENPVSVYDFHATMLYLLGVNHKRLAVKFQRLDVRLTSISGDVAGDILAWVRGNRSLTVSAPNRSRARKQAVLEISITYYLLRSASPIFSSRGE